MNKKLYKIEEGKKLCGVCGGIGEYIDLDPTIVRILWVLISFTYGFGIILYIVLALILPTKKEALTIEVEKVEDKETKTEESKEETK